MLSLLFVFDFIFSYILICITQNRIDGADKPFFAPKDKRIDAVDKLRIIAILIKDRAFHISLFLAKIVAITI